MFEIIEHTADIGLRIEAETAEEFFADAGRGFASLLVENPETVGSREAVHIDIQADDLASLLHDWLSELLFVYSTRGLVLVQFDVKLDGARLKAIAYGELFNPIKHQRYQDIKAVTYHTLKVERLAGLWRGQVIIDI
ncbi:archease [bacterium]|nr:archease [bacterium]